MNGIRKLPLAAAALALLIPAGPARASSHMDAPLITLDPAANTTDVYAFVTEDDGGSKSLVVALGVYPFEEPGIGPNKYNFDDNVLYQIHVATGEDVARGKATLSYRFQFDTRFKTEGTILQSYLGVIQDVDDLSQNLTQTYDVTRVVNRTRKRTELGSGIVPPNNQGIATPFYNQGDNGDNPARGGVGSFADLDRYTRQSIAHLKDGYVAFAGQRDDGFFGDIQAIFDLLQLGPGTDAQGGFNLHLIALRIPIEELGGDQQRVGVYATTSRQRSRVLRGEATSARTAEKLGLDRSVDSGSDSGSGSGGPRLQGKFIQVGRQGNPLFAEGFIALEDKDRYNRSSPQEDDELFRKYAETPELAALINLLVIPGTGLTPAVETDRADLAGIYIPDLIKVDLSTPAARLAGGGADDLDNPDDPGFSRLSIYGGDVLQSSIQDPFGNGGLVPGGWPNGRRFGDDVVDIAITTAISDLRTLPLFIQGPAGDGVNGNDTSFNKVFPYEGTPQNGRNHRHHGESD